MTAGPYLAGTASAASGGSKTLTLTLSSNVALGDNLTLALLATTASSLPTAITDSQGNSWSLWGYTGATTSTVAIYGCQASAAMTSAVDTLTITYLLNTSQQGAILIGDNNVTIPPPPNVYWEQ